MSQSDFQTVYQPGKLIVAIVARDQGETVMTVAKKAGARGGTIMLGHTSIENKLLHFLGMDDKESDIVFILLQDDVFQPVLDALQHNQTMRTQSGIGLCVDVRGILRHIHPNVAAPFQKDLEQEAGMSDKATHELISVIVNAGYAGDIMDAARKAGAPGGTIINAKGTGREEDVKFFGITIVPEKEFLLIAVPKDKATQVLDAIRNTPCLDLPGIGVAFCIDVEQFIPLGKNTA